MINSIGFSGSPRKLASGEQYAPESIAVRIARPGKNISFSVNVKRPSVIQRLLSERAILVEQRTNHSMGVHRRPRSLVQCHR